jgi:hypothetical protein
MSISALDSSWTLPLAITTRSNSAITGTASVAAILPACQASVASESGGLSAAVLAADEEPAPLSPESCALTFGENILDPPPALPPPAPHHDVAIQPKDLAFARGFIDQASSKLALHLFYIRHSFYNIADDDNEKNIGHTWTTNLNTWVPSQPDTMALETRPGKFDDLHVWAPSIVQLGPKFHMFYTGVRNEGGRRNQRIGVATSTDLNTWSPEDAVVMTAPQVPWAKKDLSGGQQLRDPFVMLDATIGKYVMYFVAVDSLTGVMAVGAATSTNLRQWFAMQKPFSATERPTSLGVPTLVESPHVFRRKDQWWMQYTVNGEKVVFVTCGSSSPIDTLAANWTLPVSLFNVVEGPLPELRWWHSTEYLRMSPQVEYLAAWRDSTEGNVDIKGIFAAAAPTDSFALSCPVVAGVEADATPAQSIAMSLSSRRWGAPEVRVRLELPEPLSVRLAVHDVAGRRRRTLLEGDLPRGVHELVWDGRDEQGVPAASGVYFIRLSYASGMRVSKLAILR